MLAARRKSAARADLERRMVWMLASPRSGTTWMLNLLGGRPEVVKVDEPGIGTHLGVFLHQANGAPASVMSREQSLVSQARAGQPDYFFSAAAADVWRPALRELLLTRFEAQLAADGRRDALCVIKEPNGAQAAGMLFDTLPASRLLWMLRDGRDVVDSELDAVASGAWGAFERWEMSAEDRLRFVEDRAHIWLRRAEIIEDAYAGLPVAQRLIVRYEEARATPAAELKRVLDWLGVEADMAACERDAEALSFERVPAEQRGAGKFTRSATPGVWRQNLSDAEQAVLERVMGEQLRELGYDSSSR